MNRTLIITIGIIIIILVLGVWIYLISFGAPKTSTEPLTNLGFDLSQQDTTITQSEDTQPLKNLVNTKSGAALQQLTTRPISGFAFTTGSSSGSIRYVERGTGHIYEINIATGLESVLSGTTIPQVSEAVFSPDANTIAFTSYKNYQSRVFVGIINDNNNVIGFSLQPNAKNISFSSNEDVLYTVSKDGVTKGYTHNLNTLVQTELFSMNYTNLDVRWGNGLEDIYLTTKPAHDLEGFMYTTKNNILTPVARSRYGLSALFSNTHILTTYTINNLIYVSADVSDTGTNEIPVLTLKEKCVFDKSNQDLVWCASPSEQTSATFVEDWYKGTVTSDDYLWLVDLSEQTAKLYAHPSETAGKTIDIKDIQMNPPGDTLSFINKLDYTLWMYDITVNN